MNTNQIAAQIVANVTGSTFASFTYKSKTDESIARYTIILGFKYGNLLEKTKTELEIIKDDYITKFATDSIEMQAVNELIASNNKSIAAHKAGEQSSDYTKKDQYTNIGSGVNINKNDGSLQVFGLLQSKVLLQAGIERKPVKSKPLTIAKKAIEYTLSKSKFREFALDTGNIQSVRLDGETLVIG